MAKFDKDGGRVPTNLFEAAAWHRAIVVVCWRCQREEVFDPHQLWWHFERKRWDDSIGSVVRRLKCKGCKGRGQLALERDRKPTIELPDPDERVWKRAVSRFRS